MRNHLRILGLVEGEWTEGPTSWSLPLVSWVLFPCVCVYVRSRKETKGHHLGSVAKRCHYGPNEGTGQRMVKNGELPLLGTTKKAHQRTTHKKKTKKKTIHQHCTRGITHADGKCM